MEDENASKILGILIPDGCRQIYVFEKETDFLDAVNSGQMAPLYGIKEHQKEYMPVFIAMENQRRISYVNKTSISENEIVCNEIYTGRRKADV